jgi:hypothetical protein
MEPYNDMLADVYAIGGTLGIGLAVFLIVNIIEDQLLVHMGLGGAFALGGLAARHTLKTLTSPIRIAEEKTRFIRRVRRTPSDYEFGFEPSFS